MWTASGRIPRLIFGIGLAAWITLLGPAQVQSGRAAPRLLSVGVTPSSGPPGSAATVSGSSFAPANNPYKIFWNAIGGSELGSFSPNGSGSWATNVTIPGGASAGNHNIWACGGYGTEFQECGSTTFNVVLPATNTPVPPTAVPATAVPSTATDTPAPPTATPTELPSVCGDLGLGPDAQVIDFERSIPSLERDFDVRFEGSLELFVPSVAVHSPSSAARSIEGMEFGSALQPIRMSFQRGVQAVGVFVGLEEALDTESEIRAVLVAYGYRGGTGALTVLGSDEAAFPAAPTDIKHCLKVIAEDGDVIARAELEYSTGGSTAGEPRLVDDLTLVYSETALPEDLPPIVTITIPEDGASYRSGSIDIRAEVLEDRELIRVEYAVNEATTRQPLGYSPVAGDPTRYLTGFSLAASDLNPYEENSIDIYARDGAGQLGVARLLLYYNPPTPTPSLNIIADAYEITQVIQCLNNPFCPDNSIPLIQGRPTLVRLYVYAEGTTTDVRDVGGMICLSGDCRASLNRVDVSMNTDPVRAFRGDINRTLNFLLPAEWVQDTEARLIEIYVNRDGADVGECCYGDNMRGASYAMRVGNQLDVVMMRTRAHGYETTAEQRWPGLQWVLRYFPTSRVRVWRSSDEPVNASYDYESRDGWSSLLEDLWWSNFWTDDPVSYLRYHAMIPPEVTYGSPGLGYTPGDEAGSVWMVRAGGTTAHELGHNHGLPHAPSDKDSSGSVTNPACGDPADPNGRYPQYQAPDGTMLPRSSIGEWGIDLYSSPYTLMDPANTYDLMSYCGPRFMSLYTYWYLYSNIHRVASAPDLHNGWGGILARQVDAGAEYLVGSGNIDPGGFELQHGFYRTPLPADISPFPDEGPYSLELRDGAGQVLLQRAFRPRPNSDALEPAEGTFIVMIPWVEGTELIAFSYEGQTLGGVPVSANNPTVALIEPNGGESWPAEGEVQVSWQASDPDGDTLEVSLQYSPDGGSTWRAVGQASEGERATLEAGNIPGGEQALLRVCVTDGVQTACDSSDGVFQVADKGPEIYIAAPQDGLTFPSGRQVIFEAYATDLEDGAISRTDAFSWSSDKDGELGRAESLWGLDLSTGRHAITLTVNDEDGNTTSASVTIVIGTDDGGLEPSLAEEPSRGGISGLLLAAVILGAAIGLALIFFGLRTLRGLGS